MRIRRNDTHPTAKLVDTKSPKSKTSDSFLKLSQKKKIKEFRFWYASSKNPQFYYDKPVIKMLKSLGEW